MFLAAFFLVNYSFAQDTENEWSFEEINPSFNFIEGGFHFFSPVGDFKRKLGRSTVGLDLSYLRQIKNSRFFVGAMMETRRYHKFVIENFDFDIDQQTFSSNFTGLAILRVYPEIPITSFEIFFEGGAGMNFHYAYTNFFDNIIEESYNQYNNLRDFQPLFYGGAGVQIPLTDVLFFTIRTKHFFGPNVSFFGKIPDVGQVFYSDEAFEIKNAAFRARTFNLSLSVLF